MSTPRPEPAATPERGRLPSRWRALGVGSVSLALLGGLWFTTTRDDEQPSQVAAGGVEVGHIHGIGVDPGDGQLYVGAHLGMFSVAPDGAVAAVGEERNDTMAFTVAGPGRFLASGHPELGSEQPVHLGLIESRDAAGSWESVSLAGESDFHALEVAMGRTWGVDSARGLLLTSTDNREWETVAEGPFIDVAADPAGADVVLATTGAGELRFYDTAGSTTGISQAPVLTFIDWPIQEQLVGLGPDGSVLVSATTGSSWEQVGQVPGQPTALEVTESEWYAASDQGLFSSVDAGSSWQPVFTFGGPS